MILPLPDNAVTMTWEERYLQYRQQDLRWILFRQIDQRYFGHFIKRFEKLSLCEFEATTLPETISSEHISWLISALTDPDRKWFAAFAINRALSMPEELLMPMLQAAVNEHDPSFNRAFILPCLRFFGHHHVNEILLDVLQHEDNEAKLGAINAMYWARGIPALYGKIDSDGQFVPIPDSSIPRDTPQYIWEKRRRIMLEEFLRNQDTEVRHRLMGLLNLDMEGYSGELQTMLREVVDLARTDPEMCRMYEDRWARIIT
jgi:hypothetical protein